MVLTEGSDRKPYFGGSSKFILYVTSIRGRSSTILTLFIFVALLACILKMMSNEGSTAPTGEFDLGEMALTASPGNLGFNFDESDTTAQSELLGRMRRAMMNEIYSPEILEYERETVTKIQQLTEAQGEALDDVEFDDTSYSSGNGNTVGFDMHVKRMELERVNYLVRCYLRTRLKKIERGILYVFKNQSELFERLSDAEREFAVAYMDLLEGHFKRSFLSMLPEKLRKLDKDGSVSHAVPPNLEKFTFCKITKSIGSYAVSDQPTDDPIELDKGDILCLRYSRIRQLILSGEAELV